MVNERGWPVDRQVSAGDAAVDGLFSGLGAGVLMLVYLIVIGMLGGETPAVMLSRFTSAGAGSPWTGLLTHLAVSAIYGLLFGLLSRLLAKAWRKRWTGWLVGLAYGCLLFLLAQFVVLPGSQSALREIPSVHFAIAHLIYGFLLGAMASGGQKA